LKKRHQLIDSDGRQHDPMRRPPILSSEAAPWDGVLLEHHGSNEVDSRDFMMPQLAAFLQLTPATVEMGVGDDPLRQIDMVPGSISVIPRMTPFTVLTRDSGEIAVVTLEESFLLGAVPDLFDRAPVVLGAPPEAAPHYAAASILALRDEAEAGFPGGRLYGEAVAAALAAHVARRYPGAGPAPRETNGGLTPASLRRAMGFADAHLTADVGLREMAAAVEMSPFYFARLFKRSTGISPHQFVIRRRVERAKDLLLRPSASVADVATAVGFCDQSHLSLHFKRLLGVTPKAFARAMRRR